MAQSHQIQECVGGVCEHPEHKVNALIWIIPIIIGALVFSKMYKTFKDRVD